MSDELINGIWESQLEIRQVGGGSVLHGRFPYGELATISDRGSVRKERILPRAFGYAISQDLNARIDILIGHSFDHPVASRQSGTLTIRDSNEGVEFEAQLPNDPPSWIVDMEKAVGAGLMLGLSPGFRVPPRNVVPDAERFTPEPGNPGVQIRDISQAVLREMSVVTSGAYVGAAVDLRSENQIIPRRRWYWL